MRKSINIYLPYMEGGVPRKYPLSIYFVSNWCVEEYTKITKERIEVFEKNKEMLDALEALKTEINNKKIEELNETIQNNSAYIMTKSDFFRRQFELISQILCDNGYAKDKSNSFEFWNKQVDPVEAAVFLNSAITKDNAKGGGSGKK